jgi:hypothetical protein
MNLPEMWFTGEEWTNGTAQAMYRQTYRQRKRELEANDKAQKTFESPARGDNWKLPCVSNFNG